MEANANVKQSTGAVQVLQVYLPLVKCIGPIDGPEESHQQAEIQER